jgi:thioredoxin-related protein
MKKVMLKGLFVAALFALPVTNAQAVCLDYWLKGPSACKDTPENKKRILIKGANININAEIDPERIKYEEDLNKKIDVFMAGYGKPPREFAAFHLDPTLENAVRWVKKFNEEHERTMKVAVAWKQADYLFRQYKETGEILLPADSGVTPEQVKYLKEAFESDASDLPKVKGFGVDLPGDWDEDRLARDYGKLNYKEKTEKQIEKEIANPKPISIYDAPALEKQIGARSIMDKAVKEQLNQKNDESIIKANDNLGSMKYQAAPKKVEDKKSTSSLTRENLEISYYFSAKCAFCQQFKPELKTAIDTYGKDKIKLTCVDMTPGERTPENKGDIDCKWRPLLTGEQQQFGIAKTPSIIVKRGESSQLELLENYHDSKVLIDYFVNGPKK